MSTRYSTTVSPENSNIHTFERFLYWLAPDRETAGRKYESIRGGLITMFKARRCLFAEDLADTTFERVAQKLATLTTAYEGDPARYFYGVAKKVYLEYQHKSITRHGRVTGLIPATRDDEDLENMLDHLDEALSAIPQFERELILTYYTYSGRNKIDNRRALANQLGLRPNALRLRVLRIKRSIKNHMLRAGAV